MLNREQVHKVALLARLELTPEQEEEYAQKMSSILDYFEQLSELDTEGVEPTTRAIDMSNITRHDDQSSYQNLQGIYDAAPDRETDFFKPIRSGVLQASQFPNVVTATNGTALHKPTGW